MTGSLKDFPEAFTPLIVVTGDRREVPPISKGDVLSYSFSSTDIMYLSSLGLSVSKAHEDNGLVVSDKQFVTDSDEKIRSRFGETNILVIGSPAVNLLACRINELSSFRFSISDETKDELVQQDEFHREYIEDEDDLFIYYQCLDGVFDIDAILARFADLEPQIETLREKAERIVPAFEKTLICRDLHANPRPIRYMLHKLDQPGIYDSLSGTVRGKAIGPYKDYGLIAVMKNPFCSAGDYHLIYVAGVHGPGTAIGLKMLGRRKSFDIHPFGGVYEVRINRFHSYYDKIQRSRGRWETPAYGLDEYGNIPDPVSSIQVFLSSPASKGDEQQESFNKGLRSLLREVCLERSFDLKVHGPYTLPMGGSHDFWSNILAYERGCRFVIHDMTNWARGVMVEMGFSLGARRQYFLVWNVVKQPVKSWDEMKIPPLLPVAHIEQIDITDREATRKVVAEKIVDRALSGDRLFDCSSCELLPKKSWIRAAYVYAKEPRVAEVVGDALSKRGILSIAEDESKKELRICRICEVVNVADSVIVQVADNDPGSFIVLGIAKAMEKQTLPITLGRYDNRAFVWAKDTVKFKLKTLAHDLEDAIATFLAY